MTRRDKKSKKALGLKERRRLLQLLICLVLFCAVFFGRGLLPQGMAALRTALTADTDFRAAFAALGQSLAPWPEAAETLGGLWSLTPSSTPTATPTPTPPVTPEPTPTPASALAPTAEPTPTPEPTPDPTPEPTLEPTLEPTPEPGPTSYPYNGPAPPQGATVAYAPLYLTETTPPVAGHTTDPYGWRTHPITGEDNFHRGIDLSSPEGTPVAAFSSGVVDFIGEGETLGKYIQIRHSDQVTTLYAHCSKLLKGQGERVELGETIALTGSTGLATGPHLHFELQVDGVWHDPAYYLGLS